VIFSDQKVNTMTDHISAASEVTPDLSPDIKARNNSVILILLIATFVVILNETIMSVALPRLMEVLDASASAVQWLTTAFLLTMAVIIPVTGFLIQRINTRPLFALAMALFTVGTLMGALAPNLGLLIVARVVQAAGTAIMFPLLMTTVMTLVAPEERGRVMGNISLAISVAPAIGPTAGGFILRYFDWRFMFWLVLPISALVLILGWIKIRNVTEPRKVPVDLISIPLTALAFGGLVYGVSTLGAGDPAAEPIPGNWALGVGAVAMVLFLWRQVNLQRQDMAFLDLRTFRSGNFTISVVMMAIAMASLFGVIVLLPIYLQNVLGFTTDGTGLLLLPGGLVMGLMGPQVGKLYDRYGPRPLLIPGAVLVSAVLFAMTLMSPDTWWVNILIGHIVMSVGLALVFTPLFTVSLSSVEPHLYAHGSAMLGTIQQVAGAAGVTLLVAVMTIREVSETEAGTPPLEALSTGITTAFLTGAVISLAAIVTAFLVRRAPTGAMAHGH
jgi:MFS transporter, DHA2 family, lincomycin resistance protein